MRRSVFGFTIFWICISLLQVGIIPQLRIGHVMPNIVIAALVICVYWGYEMYQVVLAGLVADVILSLYYPASIVILTIILGLVISILVIGRVWYKRSDSTVSLLISIFLAVCFFDSAQAIIHSAFQARSFGVIVGDGIYSSVLAGIGLGLHAIVSRRRVLPDLIRK